MKQSARRPQSRSDSTVGVDAEHREPPACDGGSAVLIKPVNSDQHEQNGGWRPWNTDPGSGNPHPQRFGKYRNRERRYPRPHNRTATMVSNHAEPRCAIMVRQDEGGNHRPPRQAMRNSGRSSRMTRRASQGSPTAAAVPGRWRCDGGVADGRRLLGQWYSARDLTGVACRGFGLFWIDFNQFANGRIVRCGK